MRVDPNHVPPPPARRPPAPYPPPVHGGAERSLGDLFRELGEETRTLVRQEIALAKTEAKAKAAQAGKHLGYIAAGGFLAYAGALVLIVSLGLLLGTVMPDWLGLMIVSVAAVLIGYGLFARGREGLKHTDFSLERTAQTLQEDKAWMKEEVREIKRDPAHLGAQG